MTLKNYWGVASVAGSDLTKRNNDMAVQACKKSSKYHHILPGERSGEK